MALPRLQRIGNFHSNGAGLAVYRVAATPGKVRISAIESVAAELSFNVFRLFPESGKSGLVCRYDSAFGVYQIHGAGKTIKIVA